jgi:hypothetical protein
MTHLLLSSTLGQDEVFPFLHIQPTISHIVSPHTTHFSNKSLHCNTPTPVSCSSMFLSSPTHPLCKVPSCTLFCLSTTLDHVSAGHANPIDWLTLCSGTQVNAVVQWILSTPNHPYQQFTAITCINCCSASKYNQSKTRLKGDGSGTDEEYQLALMADIERQGASFCTWSKEWTVQRHGEAGIKSGWRWRKSWWAEHEEVCDAD